MICHIIFDSEYSYRYHQLIINNFDISQHLFLVIGRSTWDKKRSFEYKNSIYNENLYDQEVINYLEKCKAIILHGLFFDNVLNFFYDNHKFLYKTSWLMWGGDVYLYRESKFIFPKISLNPKVLKHSFTILLTNIFLSVKHKLPALTITSREIKRIFIIPKIKNIIGVCYEDYFLTAKKYRTKSTFIYGFHPLLVNWELVESLYKNKLQSLSTSLNIMIGNSATDTNNHLEIFDILQKKSHLDIVIYCPLSYGDDKYKDMVIEQGYRYFGKKFIPLIEVISNDDYIRFLNSIDIAIMNHNRQQGLGNIFTLLLLGKKVYMRSEITSYKSLIDKGLRLYDIAEIINDNNYKLFPLDENKELDNRQIILSNFSDENWLRIWENIFNQCLFCDSPLE